MTKITFIGMGEAASAFIAGWGTSFAPRISVYDIKLDDPATAQQIVDRCEKYDVTCCPDLASAVAGAELIFSTVTADQAVKATQASARFIDANTLWFDMNSCAPSSKQKSAQIIEGAGGRYVDVAVMAPVHPKLNQVPLLVSGPHAANVMDLLAGLPTNPRLIEGEVGKASSIKMIRSIMVKGLEALTAECTLAAVAAGVDEEVLSSLMKSHPGTDWIKQPAYNFERSLLHGERRAAEMEEVAKTLADLKLPNDMANATVDWQRRIARSGAEVPQDGRLENAREMAQLVLPFMLGK